MSDNHDRFARLFSPVYPRLRRFAHGLTGSPADADDLVQNAAERGMNKFAQYQEGTRFDSWMFRITRNLWIDTTRARGRRDARELPEAAGLAVGHDPRPATEARLDLGRAMEMMARLPAEQREVVALILLEGMGYREVAELLDLPIGTVSSRLVRGRKALLEMLGEATND
ncbi:RNA polymerase sigma factor [Sphingomicrobium astaxanthinifaciens]|uniref:RNA polymerase sigma factor n=1 Tax=Sphingomicrobium astaxanthinifaciens TaxID=1227949 RepID=UPI001FCC79A7|nr:RNA polymerase sigma factor [Sphingomicrobium astaxanthinifaciens]MCJ7421368.1 RNA polymerase sigma factor [Sphingomicrobium astaxanthinifaciens]